MKQAIVSLAAALFIAFASLGFAQSTSFTYQGRLTDGTNQPTGSYDLQFTLYDAFSAGTLVAGPIAAAPTIVSGGLFIVTLDFGAGAFTGADRWLQVGVRTNGSVAPYQTLTPRQRLTATPYAVRAANATSFSGSVLDSQLSGNIARLNANQTFSGTVSFINQSNNYTGSFAGNGAGMTNVSVFLGAVKSGSTIAWPGNFVQGSSPGVGNWPWSVAAADINGDGKVDLISANKGYYNDGNTLSVLTNTGRGTFVLSSTPTVGTGPAFVVAADVNGDGRPDLITANASGTVSVLTNNGSGSFVASTSLSPGFGAWEVSAADFNGDGKMDLAVAGLASHNLSIWTNNGSGGFALAASPSVTAGKFFPQALTTADVNGDGRMDLISANDDGENTSSITVLTNGGNASFTTSLSLTQGVSAQAISAADLNGDGKPDLIFGNSGLATILTNNGSGGFSVASSYSVGFTYSVIAADLNGDGLPDLAAANYGSFAALVLTNNGAGGFTLATSSAVGSYPAQVVAADVNGDGRLDLVTVNFADNTLSVLINTPNFNGDGSGLANVPGTLPLQVVAGTNILAQANRQYDATNNALVTTTLPINANVGDIVQVNGLGTGGWQLNTTNGQVINGFAAGMTWTAQAAAPSTPYYSLASSADGTRLVVGTFYGAIYTSINGGVNWVQQPGAPSGNWNSGQAIASSADGLKLVAAPTDGAIYTSINGGSNWTAHSIIKKWQAVASSDDGVKLVAVERGDGDGSPGGQIYTSSNSGATWTAQPYTNHWQSVASSADGSKLVALSLDPDLSFGTIFTSVDSGATWTDQGYPAQWQAVASSADGSKLVAVVSGGPIYTSSDGGLTWTQRPYSAQWVSVASSADGSKLVAASGGFIAGPIYFSTDSGVTWTLSGAPAARWECVRGSADGTKFVAGTDGSFGAGQIYTSVEIPFAGGQGSSATLQYAGNGVWQALNYPTTLSLPNTVVMRDASGGISISGNKTLEFGAGVPGKEFNAGKMGYQTFSPDALDIVGAGTGANRKLKFWSEGGATFAGAVNATTFSGSGSNLTSLSAGQLLSGTVPDARLSANVALHSGGNTFFGNQIVTNGNVGIRTPSPGRLLQVGDGGVLGAEGMIRLGSYSSNGIAGRAWDIGVPQTGEDTSGIGYSFVIDDLGLGTNPEFVVRWGSGNVGIGTNVPQQRLHVIGNILASGTITGSSDRNVKQGFAPVNSREVLDKVAALPISTWSYIEDKQVRHVGPMAQDFHAAFGVGMDEKTISMVDADGVALAAIQGLNEKLEEKETEITELKARLDKLERLLNDKQSKRGK